MDAMILGPTVKSLILNPPGYRVWKNLFYFSISRLKRSAKVSHVPVSLVIYVSKRCNFKCSYCFTYQDLNQSDWMEYELSLEGFEKILDSEFGKKSLRIGFLGGEPFLNPHIFDFLKMAHVRGKITTIVTNASLVTEEKKAKLKDVAPTMFGISLYDNNIIDVGNLSTWLAANNKDFWVQSVVHAKELEKIKEKIQFASEHKVKNLILSNYQPSYSGEIEKVIFSDNSEFKLVAKEAAALARQMKVRLTLPNPIDRQYRRRSCSMPFSYVHVDAMGTLGPCCFRSPQKEYGNIYEPESWNNDVHQTLRESFLKSNLKPIKECAYCENFSRDLYDL